MARRTGPEILLPKSRRTAGARNPARDGTPSLVVVDA